MSEDLLGELAALRERVASLEGRDRLVLGAHPNDRRCDCGRCGQNLALLDTETGQVRGGYGGHWAVYFVPGAGGFELFCKRCRMRTVFGADGTQVDTYASAAPR